ncbi:hypothetical protein FE784_19880 [Paenibacillus hemerocallicola]|uniref:Uncharacterized protein n=1 Tax=Paenibacillus hemerocallicola TaxID=1172614 RepID=A0A5C4T7D5_9BACL|nr:hypothetical protein [Paenibacillus hemerocallicola]TNJ64540.1 hypothetical protein FE784_19880 [Paenibacillus hemerocallicola]
MTDWNDEYAQALNELYDDGWIEDFEEWQQHMRELAAELDELADLAGRSADAKLHFHTAWIEAAHAQLGMDAFNGTFPKYPEFLKGQDRKAYLERLGQYDATLNDLWKAYFEKRKAQRQAAATVADLDHWWAADQARMRERTERLQALKKERKEG